MEAEDFAHGSYGDYSGVVFYGPPTAGFWLDRLAISDRFLTPLFSAILDRSWSGSGVRVPQLVQDWNGCQGWIDAGEVLELGRPGAVILLEALAALAPAGVAPYCAGCTPGECLRCAAAIRQFLGERLVRGGSLFIEKD
jgi:hypothetical protein